MPPGGGSPAPFEPTEHDVVSTKHRSWTLGHPGNLAYADLLVDHALQLPPTTDPSYSAALNERTKQLVGIITERGGRFLKIFEGEIYPDECLVMDYKASLHKVFHGLKNKQRVILTKGIPPKPKIQKPPTKADNLKAVNRKPKPPPQPKPQHSGAEGVSPTKRARKRKKFDTDDDESKDKNVKKRRRRRVVYYEVQQKEGGATVHPYALELIAHVCNSQIRFHHDILDRPVGKYYKTPGEEPEKERLIRLELRHRFFSARAIEMPLDEFAKKLLAHWGCSLTKTEQLIFPEHMGPNGTPVKGVTPDNTPRKEQSTREREKHSSDEEESPPRKKIPQKEPRRMAFVTNHVGSPFIDATSTAVDAAWRAHSFEHSGDAKGSDTSSSDDDDSTSSSGSSSSSGGSSSSDDSNSSSDDEAEEYATPDEYENENDRMGHGQSGHRPGEESGSAGFEKVGMESDGEASTEVFQEASDQLFMVANESSAPAEERHIDASESSAINSLLHLAG